MFHSFLSFLFRICFVRIKIVWVHSQFVGYITKIYIEHYISNIFYDFLKPDPDNLIGSGSGQKVRIRADPDPQHWRWVFKTTKSATFP